ncbi:MAG: DUF4270 family protein [Bacteroidota bacterium]
MKNLARNFILLAAGLFLFSHCNNSSVIGGEILPPGDNVNVLFMDTISISSCVITGDTVRVYDPDFRNQLNVYLAGRTDDPDFGEATSEIYKQYRLATTNPNFESTEFDSLVLSMAYALDGHVGNVDEPQTYYVHRLIEDMDNTETYFSNQTFMTGTQIGSIENFIPRVEPTDSVLVDTTLQLPQLRIRLDDALGMEFMEDPSMNDSLLSSTSMFLDGFKGVRISPDPSNTAMLLFDFTVPETKMTLHYTFVETVRVWDENLMDSVDVEQRTPRLFNFIINSQSAKTMHFQHDYTGSIAKEFFDKTIDRPDSLVYLQAMEGVEAQVTFPYAERLDDIIVNKAELILTVADTSNIEKFPLAPQLVVLEDGDDNDKVLIVDVIASFNVAGSGSESFNVFGGQPEMFTESGGIFYRYNLNISGHFQDIVDGVVGNSIYITIFPKEETADHVILGGGVNQNFGMKLNLTYTEL